VQTCTNLRVHGLAGWCVATEMKVKADEGLYLQ